jgi:hypothetical protein
MSDVTLDIAEAREALDFWSRRAQRLPWHRWAARREAREMTARWRSRLVRAHIQRWRLGRLERFLMPLVETRGYRSLWRVRRMVRMGVTAVLVTWALMLALLVALVANLVGS